MIISMMSFLVFSENLTRTKETDTVTPLNLKETILKSYNPNLGNITLFCVNSCRKCFILQNRKIDEFKGNIRFNGDLEVSIVDKSNQLNSIDDFGSINDHKICFKFNIYKNGSSTKYILSDNSGIYFLPSYFGQPQMVNDIDIAKELWIKEEFNLNDETNYY